jgi:hypothetical protein
LNNLARRFGESLLALSGHLGTICCLSAFGGKADIHDFSTAACCLLLTDAVEKVLVDIGES